MPVKWIRENYGFGIIGYKSEIGYIQKVSRTRNPACRARQTYYDYETCGERFRTLAQAKKFAEKVFAEKGEK